MRAAARRPRLAVLALALALLAACAAPPSAGPHRVLSPELAPQLVGRSEELIAAMRSARAVDVVMPQQVLMTFPIGWEVVQFGRVVAVDGPMVALALEPLPSPLGGRTVEDLTVFRVQTPDCGTSREASGAVLVAVGRHDRMLLCRELEPWPRDSSQRVAPGDLVAADGPATREWARQRVERDFAAPQRLGVLHGAR